MLNLILHLPTDGAFHAARMGGQEFRGWDADRYALKAIVDGVRVTNYILTMVNRDPKKKKPDLPDPFPSPGEKTTTTQSKPGSFASIAAAMMAAQKRKKELLNG